MVYCYDTQISLLINKGTVFARVLSSDSMSNYYYYTLECEISSLVVNQ